MGNREIGTHGEREEAQQGARVARRRDRHQSKYIGRVLASDENSAIDKTMEESRIERAPFPADRRAGRVTVPQRQGGASSRSIHVRNGHLAPTEWIQSLAIVAGFYLR